MDQPQLQQLLKTKFNNVYFEEPRTLKYPCIIYNVSDNTLLRSNNKVYIHRDVYSLTYITNDILDGGREMLLDLLPQLDLRKTIVKDNLYNINYLLTTI